jgi:hypothetical protein
MRVRNNCEAHASSEAVYNALSRSWESLSNRNGIVTPLADIPDVLVYGKEENSIVELTWRISQMFRTGDPPVEL